MPPAPEPGRHGRPNVVSVFARDVAHGARLLLKRPGFTAVAVLTLALGIGANTAIFSVVYVPVPCAAAVPRTQSLVMLWEQNVDEPRISTIVLGAELERLAHAGDVVPAIAIWEQLTYNVAGGPDPEQVGGLRVSATVFPMFGVAPADLVAPSPTPRICPGHRVVVISHSLWQRRFGARPDAIGETMKRQRRAGDEVIGVMPRTFQFLNRNFDVWVPIAFNDADDERGSHSFFAAARLQARCARTSPRRPRWKPSATRLEDNQRGRQRPIARRSHAWTATAWPTSGRR